MLTFNGPYLFPLEGSVWCSVRYIDFRAGKLASCQSESWSSLHDTAGARQGSSFFHSRHGTSRAKELSGLYTFFFWHL